MPSCQWSYWCWQRAHSNTPFHTSYLLRMPSSCSSPGVNDVSSNQGIFSTTQSTRCIPSGMWGDHSWLNHFSLCPRRLKLESWQENSEEWDLQDRHKELAKASITRFVFVDILEDFLQLSLPSLQCGLFRLVQLQALTRTTACSLQHHTQFGKYKLLKSFPCMWFHNTSAVFQFVTKYSSSTSNCKTTCPKKLGKDHQK